MALVNADTGEIVEADEPTLAELEDRIESGLESFLDVGNAMLQIKIGKRYREAGYATFEAYCSERWGISRSQGHRLVAAAATVEALARDLPEMSPMGDILPTTERQVRPLAKLPDAEKAEAWSEAVEDAAAEERQPTAADVQRVVERRTESTTTERPSDPGPADDDAEKINDAVAKTIDPAAETRRIVFRDLDRAFRLTTTIDIDRAAQASDGTERTHVAAMRDWCDRYLDATKPNHLRSIR